MIDYQELLKTEDELKQQLAQKQQETEEQPTKIAWLNTHETQSLIKQLCNDFQEKLDCLLNHSVDLNEIEVKTIIAEMRAIKTILTLINN